MRHVDKLTAKARQMKLRKVSSTVFEVLSTSGNLYTVVVGDDQKLRCNCRFADPYQTGRMNVSGCSHTIAVAMRIAEDDGKVAKVVASEEEAKRTKKARRPIDGELVLVVRKA